MVIAHRIKYYKRFVFWLVTGDVTRLSLICKLFLKYVKQQNKMKYIKLLDEEIETKSYPPDLI